MREKSFIYKAWENKLVSDTSHLNRAMQVALYNVNRKKGRRAMELWKKKSRPINQDIAREQIDLVNQIEKKEGKKWIEKIYQRKGGVNGNG